MYLPVRRWRKLKHRALNSIREPSQHTSYIRCTVALWGRKHLPCPVRHTQPLSSMSGDGGNQESRARTIFAKTTVPMTESTRIPERPLVPLTLLTITLDPRDT